ncbi:hypothetical protein [Pinirhizobacter soli]|uniref:hypothetical protein n=1 Tax=Pinirhizobacter soli TaxID=2786953 RepID=UPI002029C266|nr:hypothetical protein [Pinirhizobacter soli]
MRSIYRRALVSTLLLASASAFAAASPTTGLGQSWPNASDVSASPGYHVYVFEKQGVRYVQVNDAAGTVRGAVAYTDPDTVLDLPIGVDAANWVTVADNTVPAATQQVYQDDAVTVIVAPQPDGSARMMLAPGECDNPAQCSIRVQ